MSLKFATLRCFNFLILQHFSRFCDHTISQLLANHICCKAAIVLPFPLPLVLPFTSCLQSPHDFWASLPYSEKIQLLQCHNRFFCLPHILLFQPTSFLSTTFLIFLVRSTYSCVTIRSSSSSLFKLLFITNPMICCP